MRRILSLLLENQSGSLSRVAGLFSARAFNIESLTVAPTEDPSVSRMTLVSRGSEELIEQIVKQLNKLVDVIKVVDMSQLRHIERELLMLKILAQGEQRKEIRSLVNIFRGRIIDVTENTYTVEITGTGEKLDAFLGTLRDSNILEVVRSGVSGISRGDKGI